jgi:hypothetical protein
MSPATAFRFSRRLRPVVRARTIASSAIACPRINRGPCQKPRWALWLMVTVSSGPGISAPEKHTISEVTKIAANVLCVACSVTR